MTACFFPLPWWSPAAAAPSGSQRQTVFRSTGVPPGLLLALVVLAACSDSSGPRPAVDEIIVSSPVSELIIGETARLSANALDAAGDPVRGVPVIWSSSNANVASVNSSGLVTANAPGSANISATVGRRSGFVSLGVRPASCAAATEGTLPIGATHSSALRASDCHFIHGAHARGWQLLVNEITTLQIDLMSQAFDALLAVTDLQMNLVTFNDDGGEGLNSRLIHTFQPGSYIVWATSYGRGSTGSFQLSIQRTSTPTCSAHRPVHVGQTVSGSLLAASCEMNNRYRDSWLLDVTETRDLRIDLRSGDFDAYLIITDERGIIVDLDDDSGGGTDARVATRFAPGRYVVIVTSYFVYETGRYELSVQQTLGSVVLLRSQGAVRIEQRDGNAAPQPLESFLSSKALKN